MSVERLPEEPMLLTANDAPNPTPAALPLDALTPIETATTPAPAMIVEVSLARTATVPGVVSVVLLSEAVVLASITFTEPAPARVPLTPEPELPPLAMAPAPATVNALMAPLKLAVSSNCE